MKVIMKKQKNSWKIGRSLLFFVLFFTVGKNAIANETNAGLCNGNWGLVGGYVCDVMPGGGWLPCYFFGKDNDRNGVYRSGTSDQCIVDNTAGIINIDCNRMCSMNNNCSNVQCPSGLSIEDLDARLNKQNKSTGKDEVSPD